MPIFVDHVGDFAGSSTLRGSSDDVFNDDARRFGKTGPRTMQSHVETNTSPASSVSRA